MFSYGQRSKCADLLNSYDNSIIADHGKKKRQTVCLVHCPIPFPWNASKPVNVMKYGLGFRYACLGPLEVADFGGLDTFTHISSYLLKDLCDSKEVPELMQAHFDAGEYGVKSEKGFYDYSDGRAEEATKERDEKFLRVYQALYGSK